MNRPEACQFAVAVVRVSTYLRAGGLLSPKIFSSMALASASSLATRRSMPLIFCSKMVRLCLILTLSGCSLISRLAST